MENLYDKASEILNQVKQAVVGKDDAIDNIFAAILAGGHILIEDMPGVGKTTMALSFAKEKNTVYYGYYAVRFGRFFNL